MEVQGCSCEEERTGNFELDVYLNHLKRREIILKGEINESIIEKLILPLQEFNESDDFRESTEREYCRYENPIFLYISSPGGYAHSGLVAVSAIAASRTPVIAINVGNCCSAAFFIYLSAHHRVAYKNSIFMAHEAANGVNISKRQEHKENLEYLDLFSKQADELILSRSRITKKQLDKINLQKLDYYFDAQMGIELGVVDEIIPVGLGYVPIKKLSKPKPRTVAQKAEGVPKEVAEKIIEEIKDKGKKNK